MGNYKDRGILKWAPFDALDGHTSIIEEMIFNINKKEKRSLSEDEYQELNENLAKATASNAQVYIEYYNDGYTYQTFGLIEKVDPINKELVLKSGEALKFDSILNLVVED